MHQLLEFKLQAPRPETQYTQIAFQVVFLQTNINATNFDIYTRQLTFTFVRELNEA